MLVGATGVALVSVLPGAATYIILPLFGISLIAVVTLSVVGFGLAGLARLVGMPPIEPLMVPLVGFCLLTVLVHVPQAFLSGSRPVIVLLLAFALIGCAVAIIRQARSHACALLDRTSGSWLAPMLLAVGGWLLTALPALGLASVFPLLGENSDWVFYATMTNWWQTHSGWALLSDPMYATAVAGLPQYADLVGTSSLVQYLSTLQIISGLDGLELFLPGLLALRALAVLAVWFLCRQGFFWSERRTVAPCALVALSSSQIAIAYYSFGNQVAALVVLPLAILWFLQLLDHPGVWTIAFAALGMASLDTYIVMAPHLAVIGGLLLAAHMVRTRQWRAPVGSTALAVLVALALSPGVWVELAHLGNELAFWRPGGSYASTWGDARENFVGLPTWFGVADVSIPGLSFLDAAAPDLAMALAVAGLVTCSAFAVLGGREQQTPRLVLLGSALVLAVLYAYPFAYGFNKSLISLGFVTDIGIVGGLAVLGRLRRARVLGAVLGASYVVGVLFGTAAEVRTLSANVWRPMNWVASDVLRVLEHVPEGAQVALPDGAALAPRLTSVVGYALVPRAQPTGGYQTDYLTFFGPATGHEDFALVIGDREAGPTFSPAAVARSGDVELLPRAARNAATWRFTQPLYVSATQPLVLDWTGDQPTLNGSGASDAARLSSPVTVLLDVATGHATDAVVTAGGSSQRVSMPSGFARIDAGELDPGERIEVRPLSDAHVWATSAVLATAVDKSLFNDSALGSFDGHEETDEVLEWTPPAQTGPDDIKLRVRSLGPASDSDTDLVAVQATGGVSHELRVDTSGVRLDGQLIWHPRASQSADTWVELVMPNRERQAIALWALRLQDGRVADIQPLRTRYVHALSQPRLLAGSWLDAAGSVSTQIIVANDGAWPTHLTYEISTRDMDPTSAWQTVYGRTIALDEDGVALEQLQPEAAAAAVASTGQDRVLGAFVVVDGASPAALTAIPVVQLEVHSAMPGRLRLSSGEYLR